jgi:hypothetical protein
MERFRVILLSEHIKNRLLVHTYYSRFIPEGIVEASEIFLRDAHVLRTLLSCEEYCRRIKPIAV